MVYRQDVVIGTRDPQATLAGTGPDAMGKAPFAHWYAAHGEIGVATFAEAAADAEIIVNATNAVREVLKGFGHRDIIDLGDITTARGPEMLLPVWLRIWRALGTGDFNFKIAR